MGWATLGLLRMLLKHAGIPGILSVARILPNSNPITSSCRWGKRSPERAGSLPITTGWQFPQPSTSVLSGLFSRVNSKCYHLEESYQEQQTVETYAFEISQYLGICQVQVLGLQGGTKKISRKTRHPAAAYRRDTCAPCYLVSWPGPPFLRTAACASGLLQLALLGDFLIENRGFSPL